MRGAHDDGSHGSKCLMGLRPGKRRDCGNGAESRGLAAADSREAEPQREASCELARDDQRAGNDHERREDTQKSPFAFSSRFLDPITTYIRTNPTVSGTKASGSSGFSMASPLECCDSEISLANHGIWAAWRRLVMGLDPDVRRCRNMVHSVK